MKNIKIFIWNSVFGGEIFNIFEYECFALKIYDTFDTVSNDICAAS